jgi:hypothetical protein
MSILPETVFPLVILRSKATKNLLVNGSAEILLRMTSENSLRLPRQGGGDHGLFGRRLTHYNTVGLSRLNWYPLAKIIAWAIYEISGLAAREKIICER